ncbi:MAG: hypothetical protein AAB250_11695 [Bdellovibrionota bacterium]
MNRSFLMPLKVFVRLYWPLLTFLVLIQAYSIFDLRSELIQDPFAQKSEYDGVTTTYAILEMIAAYSAFVLILGIFFNVRARASWLYRLPISERAFLFVPMALIFAYGAVLHRLIPWGPFTSGLNMVLFGAPFLSFLVIKNSRTILGGVFKSAALAGFLFFMWNTLFLEWSVRQELFRVDLFYIAVFAVLALVLERRQRALVLAAPLILLIGVGVKLMAIERSTPRSLIEATENASYVENEKTIGILKSLALDAGLWETLDAYSMPVFVRLRMQDYLVAAMSAEEQLRYFQNIERNENLWEPRAVNKSWALRPSLYPQPRVRAGQRALMPINDRNVKPLLVEYLYANWKDSRLFCAALPYERSVRFATKIFESNCGRSRLFFEKLWTDYREDRGDDFERTIDSYMLSSNPKTAEKIRSSLKFDFFLGFDLSTEVREKIGKPFSDRRVTADVLAQLKDVVRAERAKHLAPLRVPRDQFLRIVEADTSPFKPSVSAGVYLVRESLGSYIYDIEKIHERRWSLAEAFGYWLQNPLNIEYPLYNGHLRRYLSDEANWPRIQEFLLR